MELLERIQNFFSLRKNTPLEVLMKVVLTIVAMLIFLKVVGLIISVLVSVAFVMITIALVVFAYKLLKEASKKE